MGSLISDVSSRQVKAEKERLEQDKYIAETEKNLYVKVFKNQLAYVIDIVYPQKSLLGCLNPTRTSKPRR